MARGSNPMLAKIQAHYERRLAFSRSFTVQQCVDMMMIAAHDVFGFGPDRLNKLEKAFYDVFREYAKMTIDDAKDDKEIEYTKGKVDAKLEQIMGEYFVSWEERYG